MTKAKVCSMCSGVVHVSRLEANDGIEVDVSVCTGCGVQTAYVLRSPWNVQFEDENGKNRTALELGISPQDALGKMAIRHLRWKLKSSGRSSTYD